MGQMNFYKANGLGAPALGTLGTGDLARVLDACLVNGFTAQSVTAASVASAVATWTVNGHGYYIGQRITIAGVSGGPTGYAGLNAVKRITAVTTNTFSTDATGVSNGTPTGTITAQLASLGWATAFTATNQRAYRAASGLRHYLMINDNSNTNTCIVRAYHAMTAVTTGTNPYPTATQSDTNLRWVRPDPTGYPGGTYDDDWVLVGDDKRFFIGICTGGSTGYKFWSGFGEFLSYKPSDAYNGFILGNANNDGTDTISSIWPGIKVDNPQQSSQSTDTYYSTSFALARHQNQSTVSWIAGLLAHGHQTNYPYEAYMSGTGWTAGQSSSISGGIEIDGAIEILENITGTGRYERRGQLPILTTFSSPDFENNHMKLYSNITNFGDVLLVRGVGSQILGGISFPVGDWDTVVA